jgi:GDP-L-fucose synthase
MSNLRIYVAGHKGMVGSSLIRILKKEKVHLITKDRKDLDLTNQAAVQNFFKAERIDQVYLAAAKVGGIYANNTYPAEFIYENLIIETNIIHAAFLGGVKKILFLGSSCIYPRLAEQPISENSLLASSLEPTNEPYAIAKIAGIKMCESYNRQYGNSHGIDYRSVMPTNIYGPGDNYHPENSHVVAALIRRFHEAKVKSLPKVIIWGSGKVKREVIFVDDVARASIFIMNLNKDIYVKNTKPMCSSINVGVGFDLTIKELSKTIQKVIGYTGNIEFDLTKPEGVPRKILDSEKIKNLGWKPEVSLKEGLIKTYESFKKLNLK